MQQLKITYSTWTIPPLRKNDCFLMEDFLEYGFPKHQLEKLNACRMYLQVTTLAEITNHVGDMLLPQILTNYTHPIPKGLTSISTSLLQWPKVHPPAAACWRIWTKTIDTLYTGSAKGTRLRNPLRPWNSLHSKYRFWHWRMHDPDHMVFCHSPIASPRVSHKVSSRRTTAKFTPTIQ